MKGSVSLGTDCQSIYFISTIFLKFAINGVRVPQFKLYYIRNTTHTSHTKLVKFCHEVHSMWWGSQYLELQEWKDLIK